MKKKLFICSLILGTAMGNSLLAQTLTAREIQEKAIEATRVSGTENLATITTINEKGQKRVRELASMTKLYDNGLTEKKLIRFVSPADVKGTGFLTFDYNEKNDDKWIYMPALRKTRRIISSENAKSFMGTEFSYADMTFPKIDDFNYKLMGEEEALGELCYVIEIEPKNEDVLDENGFSKKVSYISKNNFVNRKSIYFDPYGDKEKIMLVKEYKEIDKKNHKYRMLLIEISNIQNGRKSINKINKVVYNPNVPDSYFTTRYLEH